MSRTLVTRHLKVLPASCSDRPECSKPSLSKRIALTEPLEIATEAASRPGR